MPTAREMGPRGKKISLPTKLAIVEGRRVATTASRAVRPDTRPLLAGPHETAVPSCRNWWGVTARSSLVGKIENAVNMELAL